MGGIGVSELVLLALIALLVVGPRRLPEMARGLGQITRTARGAWLTLKSEFQAELDNEHNRRILEEARQARQEFENLAAGKDGSGSERRSGD